MKLFLKYWLPLIIWLGVMAMASSDLMSATHTSRFLIPFIRWIIPDIAPETLATIHFLWRKSAHLTEYAILAILLWRALRKSHWFVSAAATTALAFGAASLFAALDEFHQSFVATRGGSPWDVLLDASGAALGILLSWCWARGRKAAQSSMQS
jgi:VanZ family protein